MSTNMNPKPCWLSTHEEETGKIEGTDFGFDTNGMWFTGDAGGEGSGGGYPVRTNFEFHTNDICEVIYTVDYQDGCSDQGICVFNTGVEPEWQWGSNPTRIAFSINCPTPYIYGTEGESGGSGGELEGGEGGTYEPNYYTFHFTYDPSAEQVTVIVYQGEGTEGSAVNNLTLNEKLPAGNYKVGFSADQDDTSKKAYFTRVEILKNGSVATSVATEYSYDFSPNEDERINSNWRYASEGNLDTAIITGPGGQRTSIQRTGYFDYLDACGNRKSVSVMDGETVTDEPERPVVNTNPPGNPMVNSNGSTI